MGTDRPTAHDERLERISARLAASPALADAVRRALAQGNVPEAAAAVIPAHQAEAVAQDRQPLERIRTDALEAIVQRVGRPPLLVRNGTVELEPLVDFPPGTDELIEAVGQHVRSVGRVEFVNHRLSWGGTGWVIADEGSTRLVATNRHVAQLVARRASDGRGVFVRSPSTGARYAADVDFAEEVGTLPEDARPVGVTGVEYLADDAAPDVALLRIAGDDLPAPLPLAEAEATGGALVALIGYPAYDSRNDPDDQARYFRDLYAVKRFAPGKVMQPLSARTVLTHDCTSLGGNSGSPLIDLVSGQVVGLHFAGVYGVENSAVGVRTLHALLRSDHRSIGTYAAGPNPDPATESSDGVRGADELRDRQGFDQAFLGEALPTPWPRLPAEVEEDLAKPSDEDPAQPRELRYTHFGVRFSTSRRQPVMTAVNIDGRLSVRIKRGKDRWFADARLPLEIQLGKDDYADPQIDRGHLVRREDPNWAPSAGAADVVPPLAEQADRDTFHYPNAAPQHSTMNQGKQLWQGLENHVLDSARTHGFRACVFTGPVVRDDDPDIGRGVLAPREFWKLVAMTGADGSGLHATAYLLSQGDLIRELLERRDRTEAVEGFVLGPYRTFQVAIRDLAEVTGYDFSAYEAADPLAPSGASDESTADAPPRFVPLDSLDDVVV
jgi:endonuclease G